MNKKDLLFLSLILLAGVILIISNLSRSVFGGDSAEFATTLVNFGISHPPGYPFYTLLGNLFVRFLPFPNIYFKISLISALSTIIAGFLIYMIVNLVYHSKTLGFFSAIFFFSLMPVWLYSIVPEVFALGVFLVILQFYLLLRLQKTFSLTPLFLFFFTLGLSFAHHHLFIFFLPSSFYFISQRKRIKSLILNNRWRLTIVSLIPLLFYLYLPIVSYFTFSLSIEDNTTIAGLINTIFRVPYGTFKAYAFMEENFLNRVFDFFSPIFFIIHDFKVLGLVFIILGFFYLFKSQRLIFNFFFINLLSMLFFFFYANFYLNVNFAIATFERFLFFLYAVLIFPFAGGIFFLFKIISKLISTISNKKIIIYLFQFSFLFLLVFLASQNLTKNYPLMASVAKTKIFENYGKDLLTSAEKNSILILIGDNSSFISKHLIEIKKIRDDLAVITFGYLTRKHLREKLAKKYPWIIFPKKDRLNLEEFIDENYQKGTAIYTDKPLVRSDIWQVNGLLWRYLPPKEKGKESNKRFFIRNQRLWKKYHLPKLTLKQENILHFKEINSQYADRLISTVEFFYSIEKKEEGKRLLDRYLKDFKNEENFVRKGLIVKLKARECDLSSEFLVKQLINIPKKQSIDYLALSQYFSQCKNDPKNSNHFYQKFIELRKKEEISVEKI